MLRSEAVYDPGGRDVSVRSRSVIGVVIMASSGFEGKEGEEDGESWIRRARPRTGEAVSELEVGGNSRMQTAALFAAPEPRRMAGRFVDWIAEIMAEGGVVPLIVRSWVGREKVVEWMPSGGENC